MINRSTHNDMTKSGREYLSFEMERISKGEQHYDDDDDDEEKKDKVLAQTTSI